MTPDRWRQIEEIFQEALDLASPKRERFVAEKCAGDAELRAEVERLVARFESEETFLESPVWTDSRFLRSEVKRDIARSLDEENSATRDERSAIGERVGAYELTAELGRGGMGVVYLATRADGEFRQQVAVKLIKRGMDTDFIVKRFRHERQILANLNHPNVARLLDGGSTGDGRPYFIMEFVAGEPILQFCENHCFDLRRRLELFLKACAAVAYAHRKKIVHRDLKSSNILVAEDETVKLLDFGIAKILDTEAGHDSVVRTATAMRLMTPEYASPEQVRGEAITPATDQYSLGVLLYELVTGARPYKFPSRSPYEVARIICEEMPPVPSESGSKNATEAGDSTLDADLRRGLDRIVLKALQKNPADRYASVEDLAADIEPFLRGETAIAASIDTISGDNLLPVGALARKPVIEAAYTDGTFAADTAADDEKIITPRRTGIKRGLFLLILSIFSLPVFLGLIAVTEVSPVFLLTISLTAFCAGLLRILYAAFFEPARRQIGGSAEAGNLQASAVHGETRKRRLPRALKLSLAVVTFGAVGMIAYDIASHTTIDFSSVPPDERWKNNFAGLMTLKRLTTSGRASQAALSPDGARTAYVVQESAKQSLHLRATDADDSRQIIAPDSVFYTQVKFSPDGRYIYYIASRQSERALYRIPADGGAPEKISGDVLNLFALSPDGRRLVYDHQNADDRRHSLFAADLDEQGRAQEARLLLTLEEPNYFPGEFSFSPDGAKLVYPRSVIRQNRETVNLFVYDFESGGSERLGGKSFDRINATVWRAGEEEIVFSASESDSAPHQLWLVQYPAGTITRLTNDFTNYLGVSLTADESALATTKIDAVSNVWTSPLGAQSGESAARQITAAFDRQDGYNGVNWTRDGRILYTTGAGAERGISIVDADGANNRALAADASDPKFPSLSPDNRFLVYADKKAQELNIWRLDLENGERHQLSTRYAVTPALSPDGRTVVYSTMRGGESNRLTIHAQPLTGTEETVLTDALSVRPAVSPDNLFVACNYLGAETDKTWQIAVLSIGGAGAPRILRPYRNNFFRSPQERPLGWSPDGRFLYFLNNAGDVANVFRMAVEGDAEPVQVTDFKNGEIFDFSISPDGTRAALARGSTVSDVVIFRRHGK